MKEPKPDYNADEEAAECRAMREACRDQAMRGDPICGGYFALRDIPMAGFLDDLADWTEDNDSDIRPF